MRSIPKILCMVCLLQLIMLLMPGCRQQATKNKLEEFSRAQLVKWNQALTQVVITDVLTPPVCSRVYAYSNIAAYEALRPAHPEYKSFAKKLNDLTEIPAPGDKKENYNFSIASMIAFSTVAQKMVFNSEAVQDLETKYLEDISTLGLNEELVQRSIGYGREVGAHIVDWAARDGYLQRNARPAYIVTKQAGRWIPTPPDYADAVEPNWMTLRPFTLDSVGQFRPEPPIPFDTLSNSPYFRQVRQVFEAVKNIDSNQLAIAKFWDCNPNISVTQGHVMYFQQKISPAGHWVHVAASVCNKEKYDEMKTASILARVSIAIADGFISCWDAKFHYNTIRPETIINKHIDKDWRPLLQTPPFPEYPSGHSVVSGAASSVLEALVGPRYSFTDSTELPFGMPARQYTSFEEAANEASISRMYGGIHYLQALNNGLKEGRLISAHVMEKLK